MSPSATDAFEQAFDNFVREPTPPVTDHGPRHLFNIFTGELEPGDKDKRYAIVSYIFDPKNLPDFPRSVRRNVVSKEHASRGDLAPNEGEFCFGIPSRPTAATSNALPPPAADSQEGTTAGTMIDKEPVLLLDDDELALWEYSSTDFDTVVEMACAEKSIEGTWLVERDVDFDRRASGLAIPKLDIDITAQQRAYCQEVCKLVSCEARRRGLSYIWMDMLCIDRKSSTARLSLSLIRTAVCLDSSTSVLDKWFNLRAMLTVRS